MRPGDCRYFSRCSAVVCPFDGGWRACRHLKGEPVCRWLRERAKANGEAFIATALPEEQASAVESAYRELSTAHNVLAGELRNASTRPSKLACPHLFRGCSAVEASHG